MASLIFRWCMVVCLIGPETVFCSGLKLAVEMEGQAKLLAEEKKAGSDNLSTNPLGDNGIVLDDGTMVVSCGGTPVSQEPGVFGSPIFPRECFPRHTTDSTLSNRSVSPSSLSIACQTDPDQFALQAGLANENNACCVCCGYGFWIRKLASLFHQ